MCLSLSLFSELVRMVVLVPGLSSRMLGVISPSQDQIFVYFPLFLIYISWFCIITVLLPGSSSSTDDVSSNAWMCLLRAGPASFFILLILIYCYMLTSHNCFKHFICYGMLPFLDGAFLVGPPPPNTFWEVSVFGIPWVQATSSKTLYSWTFQRILLQSSIQKRRVPFLD